MQRQSLLRHLGALAQARGHHPPADDRLEREQACRDGDLPAERALELASPPEPQGGQNECRADDARQQAMRPFPPEDGLEPIQRHVGIELGELRDLLVAVELGLPLRRAQRGKHSGDRFPLRDGEAGFGESSRAADQHHEKDEARDRDEPETNRPAIVKACCLCGGGRAVDQSHERCEACVRDRSARSLSPPFVSNMSKAQRHVGVGGLPREAIRSPIGFAAASESRSNFLGDKFLAKTEISAIAFTLTESESASRCAVHQRKG